MIMLVWVHGDRVWYSKGQGHALLLTVGLFRRRCGNLRERRDPCTSDCNTTLFDMPCQADTNHTQGHALTQSSSTRVRPHSMSIVWGTAQRMVCCTQL